MKCEFCGEEVKVWWVKDDKWCCKKCKGKDRSNRKLKKYIGMNSSICKK